MIDPNKPDYGNTPASSGRPAFLYSPGNPRAVPHVTIVTPFYNEGPVFHETAESVFRQSFQQWEWIIVNDASSDATALEILNLYRLKDPRVRVVDQPVNQGPSAARNAAFRLAAAVTSSISTATTCSNRPPLRSGCGTWNLTGNAGSSRDSPLDSAPKRI